MPLPALSTIPNVKPKRKEIQLALEMLTQSQLVRNLAERTGHSASVVRVILAAVEDEVIEALESGQRVKLAGVQVEPKLRPASKKRKGRNPATGEDVEIAAKPASVVLKARVLASLKNKVELPSTRKLKNLLG